MKRSGPLRRKAPLRSSPPSRTSWAKPKQLTDDEWPEARQACLARDKDSCQARKFGYDSPCGGGLHVHHRKMRSQGGTHDVVNLVALCHFHHELVHRDPLTAYRNGALVKQWDQPTEDWRA